MLQECNGFAGIKDSRILWLGNTDKILGCGFSLVRKKSSILDPKFLSNVYVCSMKMYGFLNIQVVRY